MRVTACVDDRPIRDSDFAKFREEIEARWGVAPSREALIQAVGLVAEERSFHPVQSYLEGLNWDGERRIGKVSFDVLGIEAPDLLTHRMLRSWFISAVARALRPGCKVDTSLILVGPQGFKKSTFFAVLGGEWFSDSYADVRSKDGVLQVHAAWIYEWAEIDRVTTRTSSSDVKAFITVARDDVRPPYGIAIVNQPRSSVIVGTTNRPFLDDETGSRRFHPVRVERQIDVELLRAWRDQLWAEAVVAFKAGETWWLADDEEQVRERAATEHTVDNPWLEKIAAYLGHPERARTGVTISDILERGLQIDVAKLGRADEMRVAKALRTLAWDDVSRETRNGVRVRVYRAGQPRSKTSEVGQVGQSNGSAKQADVQPGQPGQPVLYFKQESIEGALDSQKQVGQLARLASQPNAEQTSVDSYGQPGGQPRSEGSEVGQPQGFFDDLLSPQGVH